MRIPKVSVCVATRNHGRYLREALTSALAQGVDLELLVHDDASDDDTPAVVSGLGDDRIRYLRHARALGIAENRNSCLARARGRYIAWLDADDAYLPGALARRLAVLDAHPAVGLVHGAFDVVGEHGERRRSWPAPFGEDTIERSATAFRQLLASNEITTSTVVVRRSVQERAGRFCTGASSSDWEMWLRIALRSDVAYTTTPVARYRQHASTISSATTRSGERLRCDIQVARRVLRSERASIDEPRLVAATARAALAVKALVFAGDAFTSGRRADSLRAVALATRLAPRELADLAPALLLATARGHDYSCYRTTKSMMARLAAALEGTRFGSRIAAGAATEPAWEATLARIAATMRRVLPPDAVVASVAKWDPTLLRLSRRRGRQFPDRRLLGDGYPAESEAAIRHLEELRSEGLSHIVFPSSSFWWLDHYHAFAHHLEDRHALLWRDQECVIYELAALAGERAGMGAT